MHGRSLARLVTIDTDTKVKAAQLDERQRRIFKVTARNRLAGYVPFSDAV